MWYSELGKALQLQNRRGVSQHTVIRGNDIFNCYSILFPKWFTSLCNSQVENSVPSGIKHGSAKLSHTLFLWEKKSNGCFVCYIIHEQVHLFMQNKQDRILSIDFWLPSMYLWTVCLSRGDVMFHMSAKCAIPLHHFWKSLFCILSAFPTNFNFSLFRHYSETSNQLILWAKEWAACISEDMIGHNVKATEVQGVFGECPQT